MSDFLAALATGVLVCDGAIGTMLHTEGHSLNAPLSALNLTNPALVGAVHESYVSAGVDIIQTNSFGASRHRLAAYGYGDKVREINLAAARLAVEARSSSARPLFVAGSISPTVTVSQRNRIRQGERLGALREQIEALVEGGVDLLMLETFGSLQELIEAVETATMIGNVPIVAQATFADDQQTFAGETPQEVAKALSGLPVAVIGANCTLGPSGLFSVIEAMAASSSLPLSAQPNAGLTDPATAEPGVLYRLDSDYFCAYAKRYVELGAVIVGGCCGTTPKHLRGLVRAVAGAALHGPERMVPPTVTGGVSRRSAGPPPRHRDLAERLSAGELVIGVEAAPTLGGISDDALDIVRDLPSRSVDQLFISASTSTRAQVSALGFALHVQQHLGVRATLTATTWDKSIMTLQADMLGAFALGIGNVVCETGAPPVRGDYPHVDGIWEVDDLALLDLLTRLNAGRDWDGLPLRAATSFTIGARCNPGAVDLDAEIGRARVKLDAGAQFLITRPLYEAASITRWNQALARDDVPLLVAVHPLGSYAEAELLRHEVSDLSIPDAVLDRMRRAGARAAETGAELAGELISLVAPMVAGIVITAGDDRDSLLALVEQAQAAGTR